MKKTFFNDPYFNRARQYVINTITEEEILLYHNKKIHKIYSTFEELLLDNLTYYSRFIRTILWLYENVLVNDGETIAKEKKIKYKIPMSCTKFYYLVMCNNEMTRDEIFYGYPQLGKNRGKSFQSLFKSLLQIGAFSFNVVFTTEQYKTKSFQRAFQMDVTNKDYLYKICNFQHDVLFIERSNLQSDISELVRINENNETLYILLSKVLKNRNRTLNILPNCIEYKSIYGDYIAKINGDKIHKHLSSTHKEILNFDSFVNYNIKNILKYNYKNISYSLVNIRIIALNMMLEYKKNFIAMKFHPGTTDYSIIRIKPMWNMYKIYEYKYDKNNTEIFHKEINGGISKKVCEYVFDNGYYAFGHIDEKDKLFDISKLDLPIELLEHYETYMNHRFMSSQYKLEALKLQTEKILDFLLRSYAIHK